MAAYQFKKLKPSLRFPEFTQNWEGKKLNEILSISGAKNYDNKYSRNDVLSVSKEVGIVN